MNKKILSMLLTCAIFITGCNINTGTVVQKNDSLTVYLSNIDDLPSHESAGNNFTKANPDVDLDYNVFYANGFMLRESRINKENNIEKLQERYDEIVDKLRTDTAGDLVEGDALYLDWPGVTPPDWYKLAQSGAFANVEDYATDDMAWIMEGRLNDSFFHNGKLCIIPLEFEYVSFYTTKELAEKWNFIITNDTYEVNNILEILERCAEWVKEYGDKDGAPMIMPDYDYRRLKSVIFDVCGIEVTDYDTGKVTFDDPTIKRILEALKVIGQDIEDSHLGKQGIYEYEEDACRAEMYLFCDGYLRLNDDYWSFAPITVDGKAHEFCMYATSWLAVPATSENQSLAYEYIKLLQDPWKYTGEKDETGRNSWYSQYYYHNLEETIEGLTAPYIEELMNWENVALPSAWQYALSDLFDEYYAGHIDVDDFAKQVQGRLEIYISE